VTTWKVIFSFEKIRIFGQNIDLRFTSIHHISIKIVNVGCCRRSDGSRSLDQIPQKLGSCLQSRWNRYNYCSLNLFFELPVRRFGVAAHKTRRDKILSVTTLGNRVIVFKICLFVLSYLAAKNLKRVIFVRVDLWRGVSVRVDETEWFDDELY
jgi:hypothetical protein